MSGYTPDPYVDRAGDRFEEPVLMILGIPPGWSWLDWKNHTKPDDVEEVLPDRPGDCVFMDESDGHINWATVVFPWTRMTPPPPSPNMVQK